MKNIVFCRQNMIKHTWKACQHVESDDFITMTHHHWKSSTIICDQIFHYSALELSLTTLEIINVEGQRQFHESKSQVDEKTPLRLAASCYSSVKPFTIVTICYNVWFIVSYYTYQKLTLGGWSSTIVTIRIHPGLPIINHHWPPRQLDLYHTWWGTSKLGTSKHGRVYVLFTII